MSKKFSFLSLFIFFLGELLTPSSAGAGTETRDNLIDQLIEKYGGDRLLNLQTIIKEDRGIDNRVGQGKKPGALDVSPQNFLMTYDLINNRASTERWYYPHAGVFHSQTIVDGENKYVINYGPHEYFENPNLNLAGVVVPIIRNSALLLVKELHQNKKTAEHLGQSILNGKNHEVLKFEAKKSKPKKDRNLLQQQAHLH